MSNYFIRRFLILSGSFALLAGCTTLKLPPLPAPTQYQVIPWQTRQSQLDQLQQWNIDGALSVQYGNQSNIANYTWQQNGDRFQIGINSSLNVYSVVIVGQPGNVVLYETQKRTITAESPEVIMRQRLGWSLPVSLLRFWIKGEPAPGKYQVQLDKFGHVILLMQNNYLVSFDNYANVNSLDLPRTLTVQGHGVKIKIVVKHWNVPIPSLTAA